MIDVSSLGAMIQFGEIIAAFKKDGFESAVKDIHAEITRMNELSQELSLREDALKKNDEYLAERIKEIAGAEEVTANKLRKAQEIIDQTTEGRKKLDVDIKSFFNKRSAELAQVDDLRGAVEVRESNVTDREKAVTFREAEADAKLAELNSKLSKLKEVTG